MTRNLTLFDFDGTITRHDSFPLFIAHTSGLRILFFKWPKVLWYLVAWATGMITAKEGKARILGLFYKGWSPKRFEQAGESFAAYLIDSGLRPGVLKKFQSLQEDGGRIIIVSASPEEWIRPFATKVGAEFISTRLDYDAEGFTGHIRGENSTGQEKVRRLRKLVPDLETYQIQVYGDSEGDFPLLSLAADGKAFYKPFRSGFQFNALIRLLRAVQWVKNGFVFLPLFFSSMLLNAYAFGMSCLVFMAFCCASSFIYILNDIRDAEDDRNHPSKRFRPIASKEISPATGYAIAVPCLAIGVVFALYTGSTPCLLTLLAYVALNLFYVFWAKQRAILDVFCVAMGFVLRTSAGASVLGQSLSQWLVLMVFLLSMFLVLGKRWDDLCIAGEGRKIRASLNGYSKNFVLSGMTFLSVINTMCYIMYTVEPFVAARFQSKWLYLTSLWVILGNLRYLQLAFVTQRTMSPTHILLQDKGIQLCVACWIIHHTILLYI